MPLSQVADALGFADQSVFNQAFRRWTNETPGEYLSGRGGTSGKANRGRLRLGSFTADSSSRSRK